MATRKGINMVKRLMYARRTVRLRAMHFVQAADGVDKLDNKYTYALSSAIYSLQGKCARVMKTSVRVLKFVETPYSLFVWAL